MCLSINLVPLGSLGFPSILINVVQNFLNAFQEHTNCNPNDEGN